MNLADVRARATLTVPEAGRLLGIGRDAAYAAAERGEIPTLRLGRRIVVPVPRLLALLGAPGEEGSAATCAGSNLSALRIAPLGGDAA